MVCLQLSHPPMEEDRSPIADVPCREYKMVKYFSSATFLQPIIFISILARPEYSGIMSP